MTYTRIDNDVNGNPRYVVHYLNFLTQDEQNNTPVMEKYDLAVSKAKAIGGKRYHNKKYGGGIVFQSYNIKSCLDKIHALAGTTPDQPEQD